MKIASKLFRNSVIGAIAVGLTVPAAGQLLKRDRPFIRSADGQLEGRLDGPACGETVSLVFTGPKSKFVDGTSARRMMNNVVRNLRSSCGRVSLVAAKGIADGRTVYNAVAESSSNWLLLELGGGSTSGLLASGTVGQSGDLNRFSASERFVDFGTLIKRMKGANFLCAQQTAKGCTVTTEFRQANANGATLVTRYLLDAAGTTATVSYSGMNSGGFLCANPQTATINVSGGGQSSAARQRLADDLRERLEPYGARICSGWQTSGTRVRGANFNDKGAQLGKVQVLTTSKKMPTLRRED
ncbi:MAG: hypothetical protein WBA51_11740 [Erythrobacter sp.]